MKFLSPRTRDRQRAASVKRWSRPLDTARRRARAWGNMVLVDHGFFRLAYLNRHRVGERAWRAAQPFPHQIRAMARRGVRTVVSLRGGFQFGSLPLEREACAEAGMAFETFVIRSRDLPTREELREIDAFLRRIAYPALFHCKSGADRAGMMSALYLMLVEGRGVEAAQAQLSLRYGHVRQGKTGVLDAFFDAYARDSAETAIGFRDWIETRYDRDAILASFRESRLGHLIVERVLARE